MSGLCCFTVISRPIILTRMAARASYVGVMALLYGLVRLSDSHQWSPSMVASYFAAKNIHSVDSIVCTMEDRFKIRKYFDITAKEDNYYGTFRIISELDFEKNGFDVEGLTGIFIDISCSSNQRLLLDVNEKWFTNSFSWLIWNPAEFSFDSLHPLPLSTYSDVNVGNFDGIHRIHKSMDNLPMEIYNVGYWDNETQEIFLSTPLIKIDLRKSVLKGAIMFIEDIYNRSLLKEQLQDDTFKPGLDVSNRFIYGNTLHLSYLYNFTLDLVETYNWGDRSENGSWSGMLGLLQRREVDMTIQPLLPLSQRMDISFPSLPLLPYWMAIIFKQPRALGTYRAMILELSPITWLCVGGLVMVGAVAFALTQNHELDPDPAREFDGSLSMGLLQSVGIIANQGLSLMPTGTPSRIVCLSLLLVGMLVANYYSAATMTALLSESPPLVKSLEQLIGSDIPLTVTDAPYIRNKKATRRVFRGSVADKMDENGVKIHDNLVDGVQSIVNGSALLGEFFVLFEAINRQLQSDTICDLSVFNAGFFVNTASFTKKCPHLREMYLRGMLRTLEHGLMGKEKKRWIAERIMCSRVTEFIHVQLEAVSVAFGVFLFGVATSMVMLLTEIFLKMRYHRRKRDLQGSTQTTHRKIRRNVR